MGRSEKSRRRRRRACIATASAAAVTILSTITLPQHAVVLATATTYVVGHQEEEETTSDHHRQRKLTEHRRRMAEQRRRLEEQWTAEAIQNLQTLDYVLDESDTSNIPRHFIRSRDGRLRPPSALSVEEEIISVEDDSDDESTGEEGTSNTEVVHHQKSRLGPTNNSHLHIMSQFQHWQSGDRNLRGGGIIDHEDDVDAFPEDLNEITFIYDEDDPEEDLDGYDLVYIGNEIDSHLQQRKLYFADDFVSSSSANSFVNNLKEDPDQLLPFGKRAKLFNQVYPLDGASIGTVQSFGAQINDGYNIRAVKIQFKDDRNQRSNWKKLPQDRELHDWFQREIGGFSPGTTWYYRMRANNKSRRGEGTKRKELTAWMELAIDIERVEETPPPTSLPTPNPTPVPSSSPTSPPSPQPTPDPTSPPSPPPTPGPTSPPTPPPTNYPVDYTSQGTGHPTRFPTTDAPTYQPTYHPTPPPTNNPTHPPTNHPTPPPTPQPTEPPKPQPTSPPTPEATEAVQLAPPQLLDRHVRDDPWEYGGQIQYSSGRILFFFDGNPFVCTGTVVDDGDHPDRTLILTAGHCAFKYDNNGGRFADYALFIPNQDETRGRGSDETCSNDPLGCWTLAFALVDYEWSARSFPASVPWDYAIYVVANVPESHQPGFIYDSQPELSSTLEDIVTKFSIDFNFDQSTAPVTHTHGMGYTFSKDPDFRYCAKDLTTKYGISTYQNLWLSVCDMSGGSSGGAWMKDTKDDGSGTIISVNSWGYSSSTGMAGPNFYTAGGAKVECLFEKAKVVDFDDVENGGVIVSDC
mmetsp:Transcript_20826/g.34344  ORF Transcript_20826/g.34344 Transcript_20826/m.34344 type:complete len:802 (-) Transcript_20826:70-2475(-)